MRISWVVCLVGAVVLAIIGVIAFEQDVARKKSQAEWDRRALLKEQLKTTR